MTRDPRSATASRKPLLTATTAQFLNALHLGVAPLLVPSVQHELALHETQTAWIVAGYTLAFGALVLLGGRLADIHGGRTMLVLGMLGATAAALVAAAAPSGLVLIAGRVLAGAAAALTAPAAMEIIARTTDRGPARSHALGWFAAAGALGFGSGLVLGGWGADALGWRHVFLLLAVTALASLAMTLRWVPRRERAVSGPLGLWDSLTCCAGLLVFVHGVTISSRAGWLTVPTLGGIALGLALVALFVWRQSRSAAPLMPLEIWRAPGFWRVIVSTALIYGAWVGAYFFGALMLRDVLGMSATAASLAMLPTAAGAMFGSLFSAHVLPRLRRAESAIVGGSLVCGIGTIALALFGPAGGALAVVALLLVIVAGETSAFVAQNVTALALAPAGQEGLAGGLFTAACQIGGGLSVGLLSLVFAALPASGPAPEAAYAVTLTAAGTLAILAALVVVRRATPAGRLG
ncbi:MFS transporter [Microbacterium sp. No. 7]|uniref:MFS transporter n=1 Tax=Microbacterium sp. No. 7 TaxID=1714373 RepID=UPI0006D1CD65|nr:MFS transporter [Microbacterium sp. No. 7]ALJ21856.1 hypothetical protein AOA12_18920 [Microbacterium sp. No. 7]